MKKLLAFLLCLQIGSLRAQEAVPLPKVPSKIEFAEMQVHVTDAAKERLNALVRGLLTPENTFLAAKLERMQWYFPIIEKILAEQQVPSDLKYLAVMESSLYPDAVSSSGAVGYWQIKPGTARDLGLEITAEIDERKDIFASTKAAATYLKQHNSIFNNWLSSIYAYYQGAGGAQNQIPKAWKNAQTVQFDANTPDYLIKALAHRIAYEYKLNRTRPSDRMLVAYTAQNRSLGDIADELDIDGTDIKSLNAWALNKFVPNGQPYSVLVPVTSNDSRKWQPVLQREQEANNDNAVYPILARITQATSADDEPIFYTINSKKGILAKPGNEAAQLARKANIKIRDFLKYNDLTDFDVIKPWKIYYLEQKEKKAPKALHVASAKQSYWDVSQIYGVKLVKLLKYNRLKNIRPISNGQVIHLQAKRPKKERVQIRAQSDIDKVNEVSEIQEQNTDTEQTDTKIDFKPETKEKEIDLPAETPENEEETTPVTSVHHVKQGETLFSISKLYNIPVSTLRKLNNLAVGDAIQYGQTIILYDGRRSEQSPTPIVSERPIEIVSKRPIETTKTDSYRSSNTGYHLVEPKQTLFAISKLYGVSIAELQEWNNLSGNQIEIGQRLKISENQSTSQPASGGGGAVHEVKKGETLFSISKRYGVELNRLRELNKLNGNDIFVGQKLRIP